MVTQEQNQEIIVALTERGMCQTCGNKTNKKPHSLNPNFYPTRCRECDIKDKVYMEVYKNQFMNDGEWDIYEKIMERRKEDV